LFFQNLLFLVIFSLSQVQHKLPNLKLDDGVHVLGIARLDGGVARQLGRLRGATVRVLPRERNIRVQHASEKGSEVTINKMVII
jgi:hypothetical protein